MSVGGICAIAQRRRLVLLCENGENKGHPGALVAYFHALHTNSLIAEIIARLKLRKNFSSPRYSVVCEL